MSSAAQSRRGAVERLLGAPILTLRGPGALALGRLVRSPARPATRPATRHRLTRFTRPGAPPQGPAPTTQTPSRPGCARAVDSPSPWNGVYIPATAIIGDHPRAQAEIGGSRLKSARVRGPSGCRWRTSTSSMPEPWQLAAPRSRRPTTPTACHAAQRSRIPAGTGSGFTRRSPFGAGPPTPHRMSRSSRVRDESGRAYRHCHPTARWRRGTAPHG